MKHLLCVTTLAGMFTHTAVLFFSLFAQLIFIKHLLSTRH